MKLEEIRIKKHLTKAELHRKSDVSVTMIRMIEKGYSKASKVIKQKLADALEVDIKDLMGGNINE